LKKRFGKEYIGKIRVRAWCDDNLVLISKMFKDYVQFLNREGVNTNIDSILKDFKKRVDEFVTNISNASDNSEFTAEKKSALTVTYTDLKTDLNKFRKDHKNEQVQGVVVKNWCDGQLKIIDRSLKNYNSGKSSLDKKENRQVSFANLVGDVEKFKSNLGSYKGKMVSNVDKLLKSAGGAP